MAKRKPTTDLRRAIVVLGMHRSGTSALTGMLELLGCAMPRDMMAPQPDNPKGFFESKQVAKLSDRMLEAAGSRWSDWQSVSAAMDAAALLSDGLVSEARTVLQAEFGMASLIALKDPRMCLTFPLWCAALRTEGYAVSVILTHRHPVEVARSLERRNGFPPMKSLLVWLRYVLEAEKATRGMTRSFTSYDRLMRDGAGEAARLGQALGLSFPEAPDGKQNEIGALITPGLRHFDLKQADEDDPIAVHPWLADCMDVMDGWVATGEQTGARRRLDRIREAFDTAAPAFHGLIEEGTEAGAVAKSAVGTARVVELERKLDQAAARAKEATAARKRAQERAESWRGRIEGPDGLEARLAQSLKTEQAADAALTIEAEARRKARQDADLLRAQLADLQAGWNEQRVAVKARETRLAEMRAAATEREARVQALRDRVAEKDARLSRLQQAAEQREAELQELRRTVAERDRQLMDMRIQLDHMLGEAEVTRHETDLLQGRIDGLLGDKDGLAAALAAEEARVAQKTQEAAVLRAERERLAARLAYAEAKIDSIEGSASWRVTAPIRAVATRLRGGAERDED